MPSPGKDRTMEVKTTSRGFPLVTFQDSNGEECSVQISSALDVDGGFKYKLWAGCSNLFVKEWVKHPGAQYGTWVNVPLPQDQVSNVRMHLGKESATALRDLLNAYIESEGTSLETTTTETTVPHGNRGH